MFVDGPLLSRVRNRLVAEGAAVTPATVASAVRAESGGLVADADVLATLRAVQQEFSGAGVLEPLLDDPDVCDVLVSAPNEVWIDRGTGLRRSEVRFPDEDSVRRLAQRLAMSTGRRLDDAQPWVDGWLPQRGSSAAVRLHAVLPPIAADGTCLSLRVLRPAVHDLTALRCSEVFDDEITVVLREIVRRRLAFLITGGTASGKTTLLAAMLGEVAETERIVCVEEAAELLPRHPHVVRLLTRPPNVEGAGEIGVRDLLRQALRMRPDRLVVGEVRGGEVRELLSALNTGHDGGCGTLHANSPREVPARMEALAALGGLAREALHSQLAAAVHVVLHMRRTPVGRRLTAIGVLRRDGEHVRVVPVWEHETGWVEGRVELFGGADIDRGGGDLAC